jgi:hypothetical protein
VKPVTTTTHATTTHATTTHDTTTSNRTRWGGLLLLAGLACLVLGAVLRDFGFKPDAFNGDGATIASLITANHGLYTAIFWLRAVGALLACCGAFFLVTRPVSTPGGFPASAFWIALGAGELVATGLNMVRATGYVSLAGNYGTAGPVFDAARSTLSSLGGLVALTIVGSLLVIFWNEARNANAALPSWLYFAAVACCLPVLAAIVLGLTGNTSSGVTTTATVLGYFGYGLNAVGLLFAFRVGWPTMQFVWSKPAGTHA